MKTYYVPSCELCPSDYKPLRAGATAESLGLKEVVELPDVERLLDARTEELRSIRAELEAVRILLDAFPRQSAIAAVVQVRRENEEQRELTDSGLVVID